MINDEDKNFVIENLFPSTSKTSKHGTSINVNEIADSLLEVGDRAIFCDQTKSSSGKECLVSSLVDALNMIHISNENYLKWIFSVTKKIVPLSSEPFRSGSSIETPFEICLSLPAQCSLVIEGLVHESAHQHLYLIYKKYDYLFSNPNDINIINPAIKRKRPLIKIFLALHAFLNSIALLRATDRVVSSRLLGFQINSLECYINEILGQLDGISYSFYLEEFIYRELVGFYKLIKSD